MKIQTKVLPTGKNTTGIEIPPKLIDELGGGKHPKVRVTLNGYTYRSSVGSMGGRFLLPVTSEVREKANVRGGDAVQLEIVLDTEPRVVEVPPDFAAALAKAPAAKRNFEALSYSNQRRFVLPIEAAKAPQTRQRRIEKAVADLGNT